MRALVPVIGSSLSFHKFHMRIPLIARIFERWGRHRLRLVMRGYRFLHTSNQLDRIARVKDALKKSHLDRTVKSPSSGIFGVALSRAELLVRQYLLVRLGGLELADALLRSLGNPKGRVTLALPPEWRQVLVAHGFKVAPFLSKVTWQVYVVLHFFYGSALWGKALLMSVRQMLRPLKSGYVRFVYFDALVPNALPSTASDGNSHDVMSWYEQWIGVDNRYDAFCHNLRGVPSSKVKNTEIIAVEGPIAPLGSFGSLIKFFAWGVVAILGALGDVFRGRWVNAIMLGEAVKAAQTRFQEPRRLACVYLFHNSSSVYRPLWTYEAERHGCEVTLYFYSANCEPFKRADGYPKFSNDYYEVMTWPGYLAWDTYQAAFIRRAVGKNAKVEVVGPIWFSASATDLPSLLNPAIAVFDVQPVRNSFYQRLGIDFDYYTPTNTTSFLADCHAASRACGVTVVLKRKREIGALIHPLYESFVDRLAKESDFLTINADVSASRLIAKCVAVVSMPFTSTALLGRALGKPSAYYDPHGMIQTDDRAAHGIDILSGPEELQAWLAKATAPYYFGNESRVN